MKIAFRILILTNVVLAGVVVALLAGRRDVPRAATTSGPEVAAAPPAESLASAQPVVIAPRPEPFLWSQLESTDYRTYVANLRAIGCPEQTLRDIVMADVDEAIYAPRREELQTNQSPGYALQQLRKEETEFIAALLGTAAPSGDASTGAVASSSRPARGPKEVPVAMPVAFSNVDPVAAGLSTNQLNLIAAVRQQFLKDIGSQQDPNDPAYRERWKKAQAKADSVLQAATGMRAYQIYQLRAHSAALSQNAPGGNGTATP